MSQYLMIYLFRLWIQMLAAMSPSLATVFPMGTELTALTQTLPSATILAR